MKLFIAHFCFHSSRAPPSCIIAACYGLLYESFLFRSVRDCHPLSRVLANSYPAHLGRVIVKHGRLVVRTRRYGLLTIRYSNPVKSRPQMFKRLIAISAGSITIQWIVHSKTCYAIQWMVICPVDSIIHLLNNSPISTSGILLDIINRTLRPVQRLATTCNIN